MVKIKSFNLIILILLCLLGCQFEKSAPDVSEIVLDGKIIRYDQLFNGLNQTETANISEAIRVLSEDYPAFSELYMSKILPLKPSDDKEDFDQSILDYLNDKDVKYLNDTIAQIFNDFSPIEEDIKQALRYFKYYFPQSKTPNIYTFSSYFGYQSFIFQDLEQDGIGIGLDMFLGETYPYKLIDPENPAFSAYLTEFYKPELITRKVVEQILDDKIGTAKSGKLIDHMIHNGKKLYLMKLILPKTDQHMIHEYSPEQMEWCEGNENGIWAYLVDKELLYGINGTVLNRYTRPAPTSRNMPPESPGRTANFVGLKIVEAYMEAFPNTSLNELIDLRDGTEVLQRSRYKPPRI